MTPQSPKIIDGYLAIILTADSQKTLLTRFSPLYSSVFAHHITVAFKPTVEVYEQHKHYIGTSVPLRVYGYAKDEKGEAVLVDTDILKGQQHITISTNEVAPIYSKTLLQKGYSNIEPFTLQGTFEFIQHQRR